MNLSGAIGVTYLFRKINNKKKKILVFSDSHAKSYYCKNNFISISDWLKKKINNNYQILLEEVPREDNIKIKELWPSSPHTQELKNLYFIFYDYQKISEIIRKF